MVIQGVYQGPSNCPGPGMPGIGSLSGKSPGIANTSNTRTACQAMFLPIGRPCFFVHRQAGQPALRLAGLSAYGQKNRMADFKASRACQPIGKNTAEPPQQHTPPRGREQDPEKELQQRPPRFYKTQLDALARDGRGDGDQAHHEFCRARQETQNAYQMFLPIGRPAYRQKHPSKSPGRSDILHLGQVTVPKGATKPHLGARHLIPEVSLSTVSRSSIPSDGVPKALADSPPPRPGGTGIVTSVPQKQRSLRPASLSTTLIFAPHDGHV